MLASTEKLLEKGFEDKIFDEIDLAFVFPKTNAGRYAILNKLIKKNEIVRLKRSLYILSPRFWKKKINTFSMACRMVSRSFVSFESALSFHGWIPEKVTVTRNVIAKGRTRTFKTSFGDFEYIKIPVKEYEFLTQVSRKEDEGQSYFMADPLRAIADCVYVRKIQENPLSFLMDSMRIEKKNLESLTLKDFDKILRVYNSKRVLKFLLELKQALMK